MRVKVLSERPMGARVRNWLYEQGETLVHENPDILIVAYYPRILRSEEFVSIPLGAINFHPGLLPYNRGMYPHIWPIFDGSPCGVTIHYIDPEVDTGDIIAQREIEVSPTDLASDVELKTQEAIFDLFCETWPKIKEGKAPRTPQPKEGTHHFAREIGTMQEFDADTIARLRACTFDGRSYGYFIDGGKRYYVGAHIYTEDDIKKFEEDHE